MKEIKIDPGYSRGDIEVLSYIGRLEGVKRYKVLCKRCGKVFSARAESVRRMNGCGCARGRRGKPNRSAEEDEAEVERIRLQQEAEERMRGRHKLTGEVMQRLEATWSLDEERCMKILTPDQILFIKEGKRVSNYQTTHKPYAGTALEPK